MSRLTIANRGVNRGSTSTAMKISTIRLIAIASPITAYTKTGFPFRAFRAISVVTLATYRA